MVVTELSNAGLDAIGFAGGGILAICLVPQIGKIAITRSTKDISVLWSLLYAIGLTLTLVYLIIKDALAAWVPVIFEVVGCIVIISLKFFFERTAVGRRCSERVAVQQGGDMDILNASIHSLPGISHVTAMGDSSHRGLDRSKHGLDSSRNGLDSSRHGSRHGVLEVKCTTDPVPTGTLPPHVLAIHFEEEQQQRQQQHRQQQHEPLFPQGWQMVQPVPPVQPAHSSRV